MRMFARKKASAKTACETESAGNPDVLNLVAPTSLLFDDPDCIRVGGSYRRISYVAQLEEELDPGWGQCLYSSKGSPVTTLVCRPSNVQKMKKGIDNSDAFTDLVIANAKNASDEEDARHKKEHGRAKLRLIGRSGESFFDTQIYHQVSAKSKAELDRIDEEVSSNAIGNGIKIERPVPFQEQAYFAMSPYLVDSRELRSMAEYPGIMASTIAASEPFSDSSLDDGYGFLPGRSTSGAVCRVAIQDTSDDRSNCNLALLGSSGKGKTVLAKMVGDWTTAVGGRFFYVDAELDGASMTSRVGGVSIDLGGGIRKDRRTGRIAGSCISPFQPRLGNYDSRTVWDEDGTEGIDDTVDVLRATLTFLHGWTAAMWGVDASVMPILDKPLIAAYKAYGIDFGTVVSDLRPDEYPVMGDVLEAIEGYYAYESKGHGDPDRARIYKMLAAHAEQGTEQGVYGNLTAYRSNVDIGEEPWVHLDVHSLLDMEANVVSAQMYSLLSWMWSQACVSHATGQFIQFFFDELYLFLGGGHITATQLIAGYINMIQKRIRKYNGSLMIATQQLVDVLAPDIARWGEGILTNSTYKAFFGTEGPDLKLLQSTFDLSDAVVDKIRNFQRGECIWRAGTAQVELSVAYEEWQRKLYSAGRGR